MPRDRNKDEHAIAVALEEGKSRGLPDGWTVKFDARRRRKWISPGPDTRTFSSLPRALAYVKKTAGGGKSSSTLSSLSSSSSKLSGKKRKSPDTLGGKATRPTRGAAEADAEAEVIATDDGDHGDDGEGEDDGHDDDDNDNDDEEDKDNDNYNNKDNDNDLEPGPESDAETALDAPTRPEDATPGGSANGDGRGGYGRTRATTVHWDPYSPEGRKVGFAIRIFDDDREEWKPGRVLRYEPNSNRHKIQYDGNGGKEVAWLRLKTQIVQCGSRIVWALVKGFAWWPALVLECDPPTPATNKEGYAYVEFFGADQVATIRDTLEFVRPFNNGEVDDLIRKSKKKRNQKAIDLARAEQAEIRRVRNEAVKFYAERAYAFANLKSGGLLGRKVEFFRSDINYPDGATVKGTVRQYSASTKKWLISYGFHAKLGVKLQPSWVNLHAKGCSHKLLGMDKGKDADRPKKEDLIPFLFGYTEGDLDGETWMPSMTSRCCGCMESLSDDGDNADTDADAVNLICGTCCLAFHPGCLDPPMSARAAERIIDDGDCWLCPKCRTCRGCRRLDIAFGTRVAQNRPETLFLPPGEALELCSMCAPMYDQDRYCPDCGHIWDDAKYQRTLKVLRWQNKSRSEEMNKSKKEKKDVFARPIVEVACRKNVEDPSQDLFDGELPSAHAVLPNPSWYWPESNVYGFNEGAMLVCDSCDLWVHAGCAGLSRKEYEDTNDEVHPIYGKEFLCRTCCINRCKFLVQALQREDTMLLFATPVTEQMAPNYRDVIKSPMDLQTMNERAQAGRYHNYVWVRDSFELMVSNALTFNIPESKLWNEAKRFYEVCTTEVFDRYCKAAPPGPHNDAVLQAFADAERAKEMEAERIQLDETVEKKDLVAGAHVKSVELSPLATSSDPESCVESLGVWMTPVDAFYCAWMECCFECGSCGAADTMLFCVDCGESYHSFCANAPIHSMTDWAVSGWRCQNCKICEITGGVPEDENKLLFCEMCDRGFTLTELSPPLKSVPTGLFICGQCVDCKACGNRGEKGKVNLKYWSRDPQRCFRCGGCKGLVERYTKGKKCVVCGRFWRSDDTDLVHCITCKRSVHVSCDVLARACLQPEETSPSAFSACDIKKYECPSCRKKDGQKKMTKTWQCHLREQARHVLMENYSIGGSPIDEFLNKLTNEIDWQMRHAWLEEYKSVLKDADRLLDVAQIRYGRSLRDLFAFDDEGPTPPAWMMKRASRWIRHKIRHNDSVRVEGKDNMESVVLKSKMAAAFIEIVCQSEGLNKRKHVKCFDRFRSLLVAPSEATGTICLPAEKIRTYGNKGIIHEEEFFTRHFNKEVFDALLSKKKSGGYFHGSGSVSQVQNVMGSAESAASAVSCAQSSVILPRPLRGWVGADAAVDQIHPWKDPRCCCLCGCCGDDDAGAPGHDAFDDESAANGVCSLIAHAGRLLPIQQGSWVHSACALWSSEVWENPSDSLIYALDKARYRGSKLKCFGCGRSGATIGCQKQNCSFNYHFTCAKACGAIFTTNQKVFCKNHKSCAESDVEIKNFEVMKPLIAAAEQDIDDINEKSWCFRIGSLVVHSFGEIDQDHDGFHSENHITPSGYTATRIFWSFSAPRKRILYFLKVMCCGQKPVFSITASDAPGSPIKEFTVDNAYSRLMERVEQANVDVFSHGDLFSKNPMKRKRGKAMFGLNGYQFFGFGIEQIRKLLESLPGIAAVTVPLSPSSRTYRFCFKHPSDDEIKDLQRKRAVKEAEKALENTSGCARTEGICAVARSGGSGRITRALVKSADEETSSIGDTHAIKGRNNASDSRVDVDSNIQEKYREMKSFPMEERLEAKRSHIHGWGLFTKIDLPKHAMIVEYMGETIRQRVADKRERAYEKSGVGSCYMFRLDQRRIVDATMIGCMARFMNHCCQPNAYAKVISVNTEQGVEKKIVVFANRNISSGEEITYDYKFPVEDGSLRCTCGAPNCIGRMN